MSRYSGYLLTNILFVTYIICDKQIKVNSKVCILTVILDIFFKINILSFLRKRSYKQLGRIEKAYPAETSADCHSLVAEPIDALGILRSWFKLG